METVVIDLNLCPFAKRELVNNRVRFSVTDATTEEALLMAQAAELQLLERNPGVETTLLIHPQVLQDFSDYNQFLAYADALLVKMELEGIYQIAGFHPHYQFAGTSPEDVENYTNRSPYPLLHIIREDSLEKAIASHPDAKAIPTRNIELMKNMGLERLRTLLLACS